MRTALMTAIFIAAVSSPVLAQMTDPNMTCADYLKLEASAGPTPKTGDDATDKMAADLDKKINDACKASPKEKASDVMQKAMGG